MKETLRQLTRALQLSSALSCFAVASCVSPPPAVPALSVDEIVASSDQHVGQDVTVRGFLVFGTDARNLWHSKEAYSFVANDYVGPSHPAWARCIAIDNRAVTRASLLRLSNRTVLVSGRITIRPRASNEIRIGACSETFLIVREARL